MEEKSITNMITGQQQFNLRWNNHTNNILQVFMEQFATENLVDVTIACDGQFIKAHKMVLSACSPYFQDIFRIHTTPHPVIIINGIKHTDLKQIIDFMYRGEVKVLESELDSLLAVAESLKVKGLSSVRNNYEKDGAIQGQEINNGDIISDPPELEPETRGVKRKKLNDESPTKSDDISDDESLASSIKIEPPEIKDIDQEENVQIENNDEQIQTTEINKVVKIKRKSPPKTTTAYIPILPKSLAPKNYIATKNLEPHLKIAKVSKVPRPPNAFMIFANEWRRRLASEFPKESNKEISVRLGIMWKNLSADAKENYYSASRKADEEHKRKYPGYYYSPKEARLRKNMKSLESGRSKRPLDAMHLVKLVMSEQCEINPRRSSSEHEKDESEDEEIDDTITQSAGDEIDVIKENATVTTNDRI